MRAGVVLLALLGPAPALAQEVHYAPEERLDAIDGERAQDNDLIVIRDAGAARVATIF